MLKKIICAATAAAMLLCCSCESNEKESESVDSTGYTYSTESYFTGVEIDIPQNYTRNSDDIANPYYIKYVESTDQIYTITVTTEETMATLDSYAYYATEQYAKLDGYSLISQKDTTLSGLPARVLEFTYQVEYDTETSTFCCANAIIVSETSVYIVTCLSEQAVYEAESDAFMHCINSIYIY